MAFLAITNTFRFAPEPSFTVRSGWTSRNCAPAGRPANRWRAGAHEPNTHAEGRGRGERAWQRSVGVLAVARAGSQGRGAGRPERTRAPAGRGSGRDRRAQPATDGRARPAEDQERARQLEAHQGSPTAKRRSIGNRGKRAGVRSCSRDLSLASEIGLGWPIQQEQPGRWVSDGGHQTCGTSRNRT